MTGQSLRCASCGAFFRGAETTCTYCHAVRPHEVLGETSVRRVVHEVLSEDRNHNGIPDALEPRQSPMVVVAPPPQPRGPSAVAGVMVALGIVTVLTCAIVIGFNSPKRSSTPAIATFTATTAEAPAPAAVSVAPAPTLPVAASPRSGAPPTARPVAPPAPAPSPTPAAKVIDPTVCVQARANRARGGPAATQTALDNACRSAGGNPVVLGF